MRAFLSERPVLASIMVIRLLLVVVKVLATSLIDVGGGVLS